LAHPADLAAIASAAIGVSRRALFCAQSEVRNDVHHALALAISPGDGQRRGWVLLEA
jgi:hypothetical protein